MRAYLLILVSVVMVSAGCHIQGAAEKRQPYSHWINYNVSFQELLEKGYKSEYAVVDDPVAGKHEVILYLPKIWSSDEALELSWCLFLDQGLGVDLQWHDHEDGRRVVLTMNDEVLHRAKLYVAYSPNSGSYGKRHVFSLSSVVEGISISE